MHPRTVEDFFVNGKFAPETEIYQKIVNTRETGCDLALQFLLVHEIVHRLIISCGRYVCLTRAEVGWGCGGGAVFRASSLPETGFASLIE